MEETQNGGVGEKAERGELAVERRGDPEKEKGSWACQKGNKGKWAG